MDIHTGILIVPRKTFSKIRTISPFMMSLTERMRRKTIVDTQKQKNPGILLAEPKKTMKKIS